MAIQSNKRFLSSHKNFQNLKFDKMSKRNNMTIRYWNGMFQYFLIFDQSHKTRISPKKKIFIPKRGRNTIEMHKKNESGTEKPKKRVYFNPKNTIHKLYVWNYAYWQARLDVWQQIARDNIRFKNRINELGKIISPSLSKLIREKFNSASIK